MNLRELNKMKFLILLFTTIMAINTAFSQATNMNVVTHDRITINTNPKTGTKSYINWGIFPEVEKDIRRIVMYLSLAHPKDRASAH